MWEDVSTVVSNNLLNEYDIINFIGKKKHTLKNQ